MLIAELIISDSSLLILAVLVNPVPERRHSGLEAILGATSCHKTKEFDLMS
jgi:hypothetical protein